MARKTAEDLRRKANRMEAIESLKHAIAMLRKDFDGDAMVEIVNAKELVEANEGKDAG